MSRETCIGILELLVENMQIYDSIAPTEERIRALKQAIAYIQVDKENNNGTENYI